MERKADCSRQFMGELRKVAIASPSLSVLGFFPCTDHGDRGGQAWCGIFISSSKTSSGFLLMIECRAGLAI